MRPWNMAQRYVAIADQLRKRAGGRKGVEAR